MSGRRQRSGCQAGAAGICAPWQRAQRRGQRASALVACMGVVHTGRVDGLCRQWPSRGGESRRACVRARACVPASSRLFRRAMIVDASGWRRLSDAGLSASAMRSVSGVWDASAQCARTAARGSARMGPQRARLRAWLRTSRAFFHVGAKSREILCADRFLPICN